MPLHARELLLTMVRVDWTLAHAVADVWEHLVDPEHLPEWLGKPRPYELVVGTEIIVDHGEGYECRSVLQTVEPDQRLVMTWAFPDEPESMVEVLLQPNAAAETDDDDTTLLTLIHTDLGELALPYLHGWTTHLMYLEASLAGNPLPLAEFWNIHNTLERLGALTYR